MKKSVLGAATAALAVLLVGTIDVGLQSQAADLVPGQSLVSVSALPPGNSSTVTVTGQALGLATGNRADYGPHIDDQRDLYWGEQFKPNNFFRSGTPETPIAGVNIYRDSYGVPAIYAKTAHDVWFGAGYVAAQDRLFLMDGVRRSAEGRLAELTGASGVPGDVKARVTNYTDAEYAAFYASMAQEEKDAFAGYTDGVNAYLQKITLNPTLLPAEYALLQMLPEAWTIKDSLASGVFMTRFVASEGGNEMNAAAALNELTKKYGQVEGRKAYQDLYPLDDEKSVVTVQPEDGRFDDVDTPKAERPAAFTKMADYAAKLPAGLANGPGTGAYPKPDPVGLPDPGALLTTQLAENLNSWREHLHGGSYAIAISGKNTTTGRPMLESAPQLGWTLPSYLYEIEVHGAGYDARGTTVPGLPVVGIGYNQNVAWGLTTGYSKTIDSFIETTRTVGGKLQYFHNNTWKDASCRDEVVKYRNSPEGVPAGPLLRQETVPVCRTIHGPIVATDGSSARSVQYAMWGHEVETITGVLGWNKAKNIKEFEAATSKVTWNENVTVADSSGNIGYFHPGRYPVRANGTDQRFPTPGTGAYDWKGFRPFAKMPHVVNPKEGFLTNWNNKPATGWTSGESQSQGGLPGDRGGVIRKLVKDALAKGKISAGKLTEIDRMIGQSEARARVLLQPLLGALKQVKLTPEQQAAMLLLSKWNGQAGGPGTGEVQTATSDTDGPAPTLFGAYITALRRRIAEPLTPALVDRLTHIENHKYNTTRLDELALRVVDPKVSSLTMGHDWTRGAGAGSLQRAAFREAIASMKAGFGSDDQTRWRRKHPTTALKTLTGIVGPPTIQMRYEDRGSWIQMVFFK